MVNNVNSMQTRGQSVSSCQLILESKSPESTVKSPNKHETVYVCMAIAELNVDDNSRSADCAVEPVCPSVKKPACGKAIDYVRDDVSGLAVSIVDGRREATKLAG